MRKNCEINHKIACGSLNNYDDIVPFIKRLTCEDVSCYEIACKSCHLEITNEERRNKKILNKYFELYGQLCYFNGYDKKRELPKNPFIEDLLKEILNKKQSK